MSAGDHDAVQSGAYRTHVDEKFPEGLLASLGIQIPESVVYCTSRNVNNTLFGADPTAPRQNLTRIRTAKEKAHHRSCGSATR